jgi:hypothetical protein
MREVITGVTFATPRRRSAASFTISNNSVMGLSIGSLFSDAFTDAVFFLVGEAFQPRWGDFAKAALAATAESQLKALPQ